MINVYQVPSLFAMRLFKIKKENVFSKLFSLQMYYINYIHNIYPLIIRYRVKN